MHAHMALGALHRFEGGVALTGRLPEETWRQAADWFAAAEG